MNGLEIAIVGMSCRFPGAPNVDAFWELLRNGAEGISFFTDEELLAAGVRLETLRDPHYVRAAGVVDDIELFDADFFAFTRQEAELTDPQQRIFLECAWHALEDAGCDPSRERRPIGVYAGASATEYVRHLRRAGVPPDVLLGPHVNIGNQPDHLTTRTAYKLGLTGPAVGVQTACSTSLVAVHLACQALLGGDCDLALAGGVSIAVPQQRGYMWHEGGIMSRDGHCRAFDAAASGTAPGNGVGLVVLQRLDDARSDGRRIHAVIKGSAINNDGAGKIGYTAPSLEGQTAAIRTAQLRAEVTPDTISYVEAHGTGTALGDPVEIAALSDAFRTPSRRLAPCAIGAVKTNIGHLDAAAGVAGLIKTTLALRHRVIPPTLHFTSPNPQIDFAHSPFAVATEATAWEPAGATPRRAVVSSLGIGGTNAHVVLEEAPTAEPSSRSDGPSVLTIAARTADALDRMVANLQRYMRAHPDVDPADVAYTLHVGRRQFAHRAAVVCRASGDGASIEREMVRGVARPDLRIAFVFPGQGAERVNMGRELFERHPAFRARIDRCAETLQPHLGFDLRRVLYPDANDATEAERRLAMTAVAQPALFVVEYALAEAWRDLGVRPANLIGHSLGEYVAACLAGVFSLEDALRVVAVRGALMQEAPPGAMLSVDVSADEIEQRLRPPLSVAAVNGARLSVVSGPIDAIEQLASELTSDGVRSKRLRTAFAFHSSSVEAIVPRFVRYMKTVDLRLPSLPFVSCVTGTWTTADQATDPEYWGVQMRQPVMFWRGLQTTLASGCTALLEAGPRSALVQRVLSDAPEPGDAFIVSSLSDGGDGGDADAFHRALAELWVRGVAVEWHRYHADDHRTHVSLPTYAFERQRVWLDAGRGARDEKAQPGEAAPADAASDTDTIRLVELQIALMHEHLEALVRAST